MREYRFYKNELGWFIALKWFPFNKAWLAMYGCRGRCSFRCFIIK